MEYPIFSNFTLFPCSGKEQRTNESSRRRKKYFISTLLVPFITNFYFHFRCFFLFFLFFLQFHRFRVFSNVGGGGRCIARFSSVKRSKNDLHKPVSSLVIYFLGQLHFGCIILRRTLRRIEYSNFAIGSSSSSSSFPFPLLPRNFVSRYKFSFSFLGPFLTKGKEGKIFVPRKTLTHSSLSRHAL